MFKSEQVLQERYQLQHQLGRTAGGRQTWLAKDLAVQPFPLVIIKLLVFTEMQWEDLKLFEREAQVLKKLNHPRIPRYRDYFLIDQQNELELGAGLCWWGLVQDYIPGNTLQGWIEQGKSFSEREVRDIATTILEILIYLHELSPPVLHRDIKPSNVILDENQQIWLVDFGAVQNQATMTGMSFTVVGTIGYAPLEQFWGRAVPASDLYALGGTLIYVLTGIVPVDLPQRDLRIQFSDRTTISPSFSKWIEKLTEPSLEKRFASASQALAALKCDSSSILKPQKITPTPVSVSQNSLEKQQAGPGVRAFWLLGSLCFFSLAGTSIITIPDYYQREAVLQAEAISVPGKVIDKRLPTYRPGVAGLVPSQKTSDCSITIRFQTREGEIRESDTSCEGISIYKYEHVRILYNPEKLDQIWLDRGVSTNAVVKNRIQGSLWSALYGLFYFSLFLLDSREKVKREPQTK